MFCVWTHFLDSFFMEFVNIHCVETKKLHLYSLKNTYIAMVYIYKIWNLEVSEILNIQRDIRNSRY